MSGGSGMNSTNVDLVVNFELTSLSRAGRNEAAHKALSKKAAEANELERAVKKAAIRKKNRELAAETFDASTFGEGNTNDRKREEMCSSPRLHPQKELQAKRDYRGQRMGVFQGILHTEVPKLDLVDIGGITTEGQKQYKEGRTPRTIEDEEDDGNTLIGTETIEESSFKAGTMVGTINNEEMDVASARQVIRKHVSPSEKLRIRLERVASPLKSRKAPLSHEGSSFLSPSRWKEPFTAKPPAVGHYRPKHLMVEHRVFGGAILPPGSHTAREKRERVVQNPKHHGATNAGPHTARLSVTNPDLTVSLSAQGVQAVAAKGEPVKDDEPGAKKATGPIADVNSTYVFKSASPNRQPPRKTYGADKVYWPLNDNITSTSSTNTVPGGVKFDHMRGRYPIDVKTAAPDATYPLVSGLSQECWVDMDRQGLRAPLTLPGAADRPYYDQAGACKDALKHKKAPEIDFTKTSPRKPMDHARPTVSVEAVEGDLTRIQQKPAKVPTLDRMMGRPEAKVLINDLQYTTNDEMTTRRLRAAIVRHGEGTGHKGLFNPSITDKCNYEPNPDVVRPKILREIDFSKDTPRPAKDRTVHMADLVYDTDTQLSTQRLKGNPMMNSHLTRAKRNKGMSARSYAPDVIYNVEHAGGAMGRVKDDKGSVDFAKHVPRSVVFKRRGYPSENWLEAHPRGPGPGEYSPKSPNPLFEAGASKMSSVVSPAKKGGSSYGVHA